MNLPKLAVSRRRGQGLVEYALILALIAIIVVVILSVLGIRVGVVFARIIVQIKYPADYSGDLVTVTADQISTAGGKSCATPTDCTSATTVTVPSLGDSTYCVYVVGGGVDCGNPPSVSSRGGSGSAIACVVAVEGHTLANGPVCMSP